MDPGEVQRTERVEIGATPLFQIVGCSVTGESHLARQRPGDDSFGMADDANRLAVVVCDGAGSAAQGGRGATFISQLLPARLLEHWKAAGSDAFTNETAEAVIATALDAAREELEKLAMQTGAAIADFNTTVVGLIAEGELAAMFQIGDGAGGCFSRAAESASWTETRVSAPDNGEYVNETSFLTSPNWRANLRCSAVGGFEAALLVTDGVTPFALTRSQKNFDMAFADGLLSFMATHPPEAAAGALRNLLLRPDVLKVSDDDKTMVCVQRTGAPPAQTTRESATEPDAALLDNPWK
ncbi:MAG TPA: protein phosphatase 2C domain-containing protein [Steroidobacteraceae bacterium]|nr:protein phosphatase 2C domain-containing protein [Steroidobacteraceae bacterium]